jgi:hypothetical protein
VKKYSTRVVPFYYNKNKYYKLFLQIKLLELGNLPASSCKLEGAVTHSSFVHFFCPSKRNEPKKKRPKSKASLISVVTLMYLRYYCAARLCTLIYFHSDVEELNVVLSGNQERLAPSGYHSFANQEICGHCDVVSKTMPNGRFNAIIKI